MAYQLFQIPRTLNVSSNLTLVSGAKASFSLAGTNTPAAVYQDSDLLTPHTQPVTADSAGVFDPIYLDPAVQYRVTITTSTGVVLPGYPIDDVNDQILSQAVIGSYLYPRTAAEVSAGVTPVNYAYAPGNVLRYGNNTTPGTTDMGSAFQAASNSGGAIYVPAGTYKIGSTVTVLDGQLIYGDGRELSIIVSPAGVSTFNWHPAGSSTRTGPFFEDLAINSDKPVTFNVLTTTLADGSGDPYCLRARVKRCKLTAITAGGSGTIGISAAKAFDSDFVDNEIVSYECGIIIHGCDLCRIAENRIYSFTKYGILEQSAQTFGSQNRIHHNDILLASGTTATYIKSTSREVSIHDNYLEKPSGTCTGFIDITSTGAPTYGSNSITLPQSVVIRDNRVDGESFGSFVYRIDPTNALTIVCDNRKTVGTTGASSFTQAITAMPNPTQGARRAISIAGESWGIWDGYSSRGAVTGSPKGFYITGENINAIVNFDQSSEIQIRGNRLIIPAAFSGTARLVPGSDDLTHNYLFNSAATYTATIILRSTAAAGDSLTIAMGSTGHGDSGNVITLNDQWKRHSWSFSGKAVTGFDYMGPYMTRSGSNGDIEILSIAFEMLENMLPSLPSSAPAGGSRALWYDGADSNRVKFVP